jgi:hypothetical protein
LKTILMQNGIIPFFPLSTLSQIGNSQLYKMGFFTFYCPTKPSPFKISQRCPLSL